MMAPDSDVYGRPAAVRTVQLLLDIFNTIETENIAYASLYHLISRL
jgi:hypothetical protein